MDISKKVKKPNYWRVITPPDIFNLPIREVIVQGREDKFFVAWREYNIHSFFTLNKAEWKERGSFVDFDEAVLFAKGLVDELRFVRKDELKK